jgi:putative transcriptional regulator
MNQDLFDQLRESIEEAGQIRRGKLKPTRVTKIEPVSARVVRHKLGLSQTQFASLLGISTATLRNWEQGRREPRGAAKVLIRIASKHPETVLEAAI